MVLYGQELQFLLSASRSRNSLLPDTAEVRHNMKNRQRNLEMIKQYVKENIGIMQAPTTRAVITAAHGTPAISPDLALAILLTFHFSDALQGSSRKIRS
ncbi:hypothetical protein PoB_002931100 [Plakobranchus ocellatus]|uniref:Uncharacterized protein n=1 Tax=Plakobranchus ocellatus TaxID=259542 RepID=A0AAV4A7Z4_9GAST|nr:hypothetical protein PoB_002931100 [Plakobranchus ocellatus]